MGIGKRIVQAFEVLFLRPRDRTRQENGGGGRGPRGPGGGGPGGGTSGQGVPPATCQIGWQPSVLAPVFYGVREYGPAQGAPAACRVFFPSLDGAVFDAPILEGCGRYPLILFAHGNCNEPEHYKKWFEVPAALARSGNVVAAPELPATSGATYPWSEPHPDLGRLVNTLSWMRLQWEHAAVLLPAPATGIIGHSYGALLGARLAATTNVSAYASLSGAWDEWPADSPRPINNFAVPMLFMWGGGFDSRVSLDALGLWGGLGKPKHKVIFSGAEHWDYLPAGRTSCEGGLRGPCNRVVVLSMDIVATFFGKYLPPEQWPGLGALLPPSLIAPALSLTTEQQFYAGGHLLGMSLIAGRPECSVTLAWQTVAGASGSVTRP